MKKFICLLIFLAAVLVFAQDVPKPRTPYTPLNITYGVVAPGCESIDAKKINELHDCLGRFLHSHLAAELDYFPERMKEVSSVEEKTKIQFVVNQEGRLTDIAISEEELKSEFSDAVIQAFGKIAEEVSFQPAAYINGNPSRLRIAIPVIMFLESDDKDSDSEERK